MATGSDLFRLAQPHVGEIYRNVLVPKDDPNCHGPWDCAEFASWVVYQASGTLYGCDPHNRNPRTTEAYTGFGKTMSAGSAIGSPWKTLRVLWAESCCATHLLRGAWGISPSATGEGELWRPKAARMAWHVMRFMAVPGIREC